MTPTRPAPDVLRQARELRQVLEGLAAALAQGEAAAVLAAEPALQTVVASAGVVNTASPEERAAVTAELALARMALARCRAIGAASAELTSVTLDVLGRTGPYSRHGAGQPRGSHGRDLHARV